MHRSIALTALGLLGAGIPHGNGPATVATRFDPPPRCQRVAAEPGSFGAWLRALPLKPEGWPVHLYDGRLKANQQVHAAVIDLSVGDRDLQQCADAVMRLHAEHLFATGRQDAIAFHFTNGFLAEWQRWRAGERIAVEGDRCRWLRRAEPDASHAELMRFLTIVFTYAGTLSLERDLQPVAAEDLRIGDVFVDGGSPGHAVIVVDLARDPEGRTYLMLAQSYMPAQEIHVLRNTADPSLGPWFALPAGGPLRTPEWTFEQARPARFRDADAH